MNSNFLIAVKEFTQPQAVKEITSGWQRVAHADFQAFDMFADTLQVLNNMPGGAAAEGAEKL